MACLRVSKKHVEAADRGVAGIETIKLDVTSEDSIASSVATVKRLTGGSLDALLNNAGATYQLPLMDIDIEKARELFDLNTWAMLRMTRAFLPLLRKSTVGPKVINNISCSSLPAGGSPWQGAYNASKAATTSLTETLRLELAPLGVKVINLMTGSVISTIKENAPKTTLPSTSLYINAKETIEKVMSGGEAASNGADTAHWAAQVVRDLSKKSPPYWIFGGSCECQCSVAVVANIGHPGLHSILIPYIDSLIVRIGALLPVGFFDSIMRNFGALDVVQQEIRQPSGVKVAGSGVVM